LRTDLYASLILWTLLVPQGLAYAQTAGLPPQYGLYAALGGMVGYAVIGVSRQATIGPEATVALLSATVVAPLAAGDASAFAALSAALGILVGLVCAGIGLLRLGFLARLLSRPVLAGYLVGTGVTMILSQADKLLGVDVSSYDALTMAGQLWQALGDANMVDLAIGIGVIVSIPVASHRRSPHTWLPWSSPPP
jgi:MFS superfamily sulfate permease-like transporter